jgi:hypothetical protein
MSNEFPENLEDYESHITVSPKEIEISYSQFSNRSSELGWKTSKFEHDDVDGIAGKWFLSYRSKSRETIITETAGMVHGLICSGFEVLRWKIEQTVADSKLGSEL